MSKNHSWLSARSLAAKVSGLESDPVIKDGLPPQNVEQVVEHLFRHESGKMVATLTRIFGVEHLSLAEDVVQEALGRALQTWPFHGLPKNPAAWIMRASRNLALDVVRREQVFRGKEAEITSLIEQRTVPAPDAAAFSDQAIQDDRLSMIFVCCHPAIPAEAQIALALNTLCGFSVPEISRALLTTEAALAKRLTRARQKIREARIPFEIPEGNELVKRLDGVLETLYLLFNEGYKASSGEKLVREEVCQEAIRLTGLLAEHPAGNHPGTHALLALMLLNSARNSSRVDEEGKLVLLAEQNRSLWDKSMIARGMFHLSRSAAGDTLTRFHLQAGIAACHCAAENYESVNWRQILSLYDQLAELDGSPIVWLNRAVALAKVNGPGAGLQALENIPGGLALQNYYLFHAVKGEWEWQMGRRDQAVQHYQTSMKLAQHPSEAAFLAKKLKNCQEHAGLRGAL